MRLIDAVLLVGGIVLIIIAISASAADSNDSLSLADETLTIQQK